jgi:hypothetical protein
MTPLAFSFPFDKLMDLATLKRDAEALHALAQYLKGK